ncbi:exonuclease V a 5' deoxyribonuclease-domain-containing protein [Crucibulum laeve]|uniref:Exonuclease V a 5' deoxyribonuclease-domain-containing protein n=1 Tax=Crucibulum laeve TaxID=68775 RepID=A0A5C3MAF8_9AGAR|nr:exonuclease V a 5' deoxyribonuclease-domain-containing protein [Crucibulum laeve]
MQFLPFKCVSRLSAANLVLYLPSFLNLPLRASLTTCSRRETYATLAGLLNNIAPMSESGSDEYSAFDFSEFTEEELLQIDDTIANEPTIQQPSLELSPAVSFRSDLTGDFDFAKINEEELEMLDALIAQQIEIPRTNGSPSIVAAVEHSVSSRPDSFKEEELKLPLSPLHDEVLPTTGGPAVVVELEGSDPSQSHSSQYKPKPHSPLQKYRWHSVLSVSDLVGLSWCEVQFDYGLRGKRSKPIEHRPKAFKSSTGKEIRMEKQVAVVNDKRTQKGMAVHKRLERQVRVEEIKVEIRGEEERWALRLVNMLACLNGMLTDGFTASREMPIFGIVENYVVIGLIDEVAMRPKEIPKKRKGDSMTSTPGPKRARRRSPSRESPSNIDESLESSSMESSSHEQSNPSYLLHVSDTKTRSTNTIPPEEDTLSSKLQLMLYHRLLDEMTSLFSPFDFAALWKRLDVDPLKIFSTEFLVQSKLLAENDQPRTACLDELVNLWMDTVMHMHIAGVHPTLQIVYRLRPESDVARSFSPEPRRHVQSIEKTEHDDIIKAMKASLSGLFPMLNEQHNSATDTATNAVDSFTSRIESNTQTPSSADGRTRKSVRQSVAQAGSGRSSSEIVEDPLHIHLYHSKDIDLLKPIATKSFQYDHLLLESYLKDAFQWWLGERKPRGVPPHLTRRCRSCEYASDCEWRDEKAMEHLQRRTYQVAKID